VRYFFLREVPFGQDGSYSHEAIVARMNADLANDIGNLAQRSLTMIAKAGARTPDWRQATPTKEDLAMLTRADALLGEARRHMQSFALHLYIGAVFEVVSEANRYFANAEPWKLAKSDPARMGLVLYVTIETLRIAAILLQPAMPGSMGAVLDLLGVPAEARTFAMLDAGERAGQLEAPYRLEPGRALPPPAPVFPRYVEAEPAK
jgi:methionyl-tRNA synthetase